MLIAIILSAVLTIYGSRWIDSLYRQPNAPLTFPNEIASRSKFRKPLLALILFVNIFNFSEVSMPLFFYLTAIIFFLSLITFTDFEQYVIFDKMLKPLAILGILAAIHLNLPIVDRILAAVIGGGIFFLISTVTKGGIGGGDVKLVFVLGLWLGSAILLDVVIKACILGGAVALIMILTKQKDRQSYFAYGPYFTLTAIYILYFTKSFN